MSKREGPESPADALTSGDIFGEILDEVGGERITPEEAAPVPSGRGPIKVQVSEPEPPTRSAARGAARKPAPGALRGVKELRPEDVDTLLDVFGGPGDAALAEEEATPPLDDADAEVDAEAEALPGPEAVREPEAAPEPEPEPEMVETALAMADVLETEPA